MKQILSVKCRSKFKAVATEENNSENIHFIWMFEVTAN